MSAAMRVYRWDLDKTYLHTDFESVRGLVRSAMESARDKRAVPGATALLRELSRERPGWRPRIVLLSGSPTQMRPVLEAKLRMDGIRFDEFRLKDNLSNLKRGRIRAVRDQFGYKLPALLAGRVGMGEAVRETLFGDDAEADALVYSVYADAIAGRVSPVELSRVMEAAGAYADDIVEALAALRQISRADAVDRIFIRLDRGVERRDFEALGSRVIPVATWFEAATVLVAAGEITTEGWMSVYNTSQLPESDALRAVKRQVDRGSLDVTGLRAQLLHGTEHPLGIGVLRMLEGSEVGFTPPRPPIGVDWLEVWREHRRRTRSAR